MPSCHHIVSMKITCTVATLCLSVLFSLGWQSLHRLEVQTHEKVHVWLFIEKNCIKDWKHDLKSSMFHPNATTPTSDWFFSSVPVRAHHHLVHPSWSHGTSHLGWSTNQQRFIAGKNTSRCHTESETALAARMFAWHFDKLRPKKNVENDPIIALWASRPESRFFFDCSWQKLEIS